MKLIMVDLDGTLCDTKQANYRAYNEALQRFGYKVDYEYFFQYCNGRHYLDFLPQFTSSDEKELKQIHDAKKKAYRKYLPLVRVNKPLVDLLYICKEKYKVALVTTASKENTYNILKTFKLEKLFDLVLTGDEVKNMKPAPDGYLKAMRYFNAMPEECIIFEDSETGICAAEKAGIHPFVITGYN